MEKLVNPFKEHMRLAMLNHEEVFREQVFELHRLYQIQKMLMKNIKRSLQNNQEQATWNFKNYKEKIHGIDMEMPVEEDNNNNAENGFLKNANMVDESELLELTLGPSKNFYRRRKVADVPLSLLKSDNCSGTSLSSSSSNNIKKQNDPQQKINTSRLDYTSQKWRVDDHHMPIKSNHSFLRETRVGLNNNVVCEENLRQDRSVNNNPPLFQVLSLRMT
ncbi:hypothetical protein LIER_06822 [Lithospermum erythrorhizon]|uniref:Uncharacterized protein n=1 Tax=Lithospermum erythrorhizon TaxID=34254 RepID=A0AAV3P7C2_LITER